MTIFNKSWPRQFLANFERTGEALLFYLFLLTRVDPKTGYFRGSFRRVGEDIGVSEMALRRWLEQLEGEGYLRDESLNGKMVVNINSGGH